MSNMILQFGSKHVRDASIYTSKKYRSSFYSWAIFFSHLSGSNSLYLAVFLVAALPLCLTTTLPFCGTGTVWLEGSSVTVHIINLHVAHIGMLENTLSDHGSVLVETYSTHFRIVLLLTYFWGFNNVAAKTTSIMILKRLHRGHAYDLSRVLSG